MTSLIYIDFLQIMNYIQTNKQKTKKKTNKKKPKDPLYIFNLVRTVRFRNNLHQLRSEHKYMKVLGTGKQKGLNIISEFG